MPANFSTTPKKPKYSPDLSRGIRLAKSERLRACVPPCTMPTRIARIRKCAPGPHRVADHANASVYASEPEEDRPLGPDPAGQHAEEERKRDAHELDEQDRRDHRTLIDADLVAVDRRHADDRADAVVVDQKRQQHQEALSIAAELAQRLGQASQHGSDGLLPRSSSTCVNGLAAPARGETGGSRRRATRPPPTGTPGARARVACGR